METDTSTDGGRHVGVEVDEADATVSRREEALGRAAPAGALVGDHRRKAALAIEAVDEHRRHLTGDLGNRDRAVPGRREEQTLDPLLEEALDHCRLGRRVGLGRRDEQVLLVDERTVLRTLDDVDSEWRRHDLGDEPIPIGPLVRHSPGGRVRPVSELRCDGQNAGPRLVGQRHGLPAVQYQRDRRARDTRVKRDVLHRDRAASRLRHERCFRVLGWN